MMKLLQLRQLPQLERDRPGPLSTLPTHSSRRAASTPVMLYCGVAICILNCRIHSCLYSSSCRFRRACVVMRILVRLCAFHSFSSPSVSRSMIHA